MPGVQKQQKNILFRYSLLHLDEVLPTGSDLSNKAIILTTVFTYKYALLTKQRIAKTFSFLKKSRNHSH